MDLISWTFATESDDIDSPLLIDSSDTSRNLSFRALRSKVRQLVAGFDAFGIQPGDCICVNSFNDILYSALYFGIIGSGAIYTGVNPGYTVNELHHHLQLTRPKLIIVEPHLLENTLAAAREVGIPKSHIFAFDVHSENVDREILSWDELLKHGEKDWVKVEDPSRTVAQYAATSGTSGLPKAALLSHSYHVSQAALRVADGHPPYTVRRLTPLPPFHVFATPIVPSSVRQGHPVYVMRRFDMSSFLSAIETYQITETFLVPPILVAMPQTELCTPQAVRSLRQIFFGGASFKHANQVPLYALLHPEAKIQPVWGMTEAGWITAGRWPEKHADDSVGRPLPGFQAKIVDDNGKEVEEEGAVGDICVRSNALMLGYLKNEAATRETLDQDGWLWTGDVGQLIDGKVYIVDRKKELIKVRGWQVSPAEVEAVALEHPEIADAAVIGIELPNGSGEIPRAYVVLRKASNLSSEEIQTFIGKSLARYKVPSQVLFVDSIPKNATGKILRRILRETAAQEAKAEPVVTVSEIQAPQRSRRSRLLAMLRASASKASRSLARFFAWLRTLLLRS